MKIIKPKLPLDFQALQKDDLEDGEIYQVAFSEAQFETQKSTLFNGCTFTKVEFFFKKMEK